MNIKYLLKKYRTPIVLFLVMIPFIIGAEIMMYDTISDPKEPQVSYWTIHNPTVYFTVDDFIQVTVIYLGILIVLFAMIILGIKYDKENKEAKQKTG